MKKAFTLAEMMIVLVVIAVITAILLPAARHATPDENILKFKKAHNTLYTAIRELVNSDKYYLDGDLGVRPDGSYINYYEDEDDATYFCNTLSEILDTKSTNCLVANTAYNGAIDIRYATNYSYPTLKEKVPITAENMLNSKIKLDKNCKEIIDVNNTAVDSEGNSYGAMQGQIVLSNGIVIYEENPASTFGVNFIDAGTKELIRRFSSPTQNPANYPDENGFDAMYKVVCIDIDGIPSNATKDDCVNECPFGYGIRADGKILNGKRADEWLEKSINQN